MDRHALHITCRYRVVLSARADELDLRPADIAVEIPFQIKGHLLFHSGEPHPSRDLTGHGVVQLAFQ